MIDYKLRLARERDSSAIHQLIVEGKINPSRLDWKRFVVAENGKGVVIGCGQIKLHKDGSQELASVAVTVDSRRQGVGQTIINYLLANHQGDLYLMCASRLGPYYKKFNFYEVEEGEMPRYFRRISKVAGIIEPLLKKGLRLLVMKRR